MLMTVRFILVSTMELVTIVSGLTIVNVLMERQVFSTHLIWHFDGLVVVVVLSLYCKKWLFQTEDTVTSHDSICRFSWMLQSLQSINTEKRLSNCDRFLANAVT